MRYFPIFVDLKGRRVLVVGGGEEATRKVRLLLKTDAHISVIASELHPELAGNPRIEWLAKEFSPGLINGATLVYSAEKSLNAIVSAEAQVRGIPVNAVDEADISTFIIPSIVDRDPVIIAIGTEGTAPVLGQGIRAQIDGLLPLTLGSLARTAATWRAKVAEIVPPGNRRRGFWQRFFFGDVRETHDSGDAVAFELAVQDALFLETRPAFPRVTYLHVPEDLGLLTLRGQRRLQEADVIVHANCDHIDMLGPVLEMSRRDALRLAVNGSDAARLVTEEARKGLKVVRLLNSPAVAEISDVRDGGFTVEVLHGPPISITNDNSTVVPFPVRDDLREAILKAAS